MLNREYKADLLEVAFKTKCFCRIATKGTGEAYIHDKCVVLKFEWVGMKNTYNVMFESYGVRNVRFNHDIYDIVDIVLLDEVGAIQLQSVGRVQAIPAKRLTVEDKIMWNFGSIYIVKSITPSKTGKTINITEQCARTGEKFERKLSVNKLVAVADRVTGKFYNA